MSDGIIGTLPDTGGIGEALNLAQGQLGDALRALTEDPAGLAEPLLQALAPVTGALPGDTSAWTAPIATFLTGVADLIPGDVSDLLAPVTDGLGSIRPLVEASPIGNLLSDLEAGRSFSEIAGDQLQGLTGVALEQLTSQVTGALSGNKLAEATAFIAALTDLAGSPPADPAPLVSLVSEQFMGVPTDLLAGAAAVSRQRLDALGVLENTAGAAVDGLETALSGRLADAAAAVAALDPGQEAAWQALIAALNQANGALTALVGGLEAVPAATSTALAALDVDGWIAQLEVQLNALPTLDTGSLQQVADQLLRPIEALSAQLDAVSPAQLVTQLHGMLNSILRAVDQALAFVLDSPIMAFFDDLRERVQILDVDEIRAELERIVQSIEDVVNGFDTETVTRTVEDALGVVESAFDAVDLDGAIASVQALLLQINDIIDKVPIGDVTGAISTALGTVQTVLTTLDGETQSAAAAIQDVVNTLGSLSFYPQAEPAIETIESIAELVASFDLSILPSSMADELTAACAEFKNSFDPSPGQYFSTSVVQAVNDAFSAAADPLTEAMDSIETTLEQLADQVEGYDPAQWLEPLGAVLDEVSAAVGQVSGETLIGPVEEVRQEILAALNEFAPAELFAPVEQAFDAVLAELQGIVPGDLLEPLFELYDTVDELIQTLDITAHLAELGESTSTTFDVAHGQLMGAFDLSGLPAELGDLTGQIQPLLDVLVPGTAPDQAVSSIQTVFQELKPGKLFEPLQGIYDQLLGLLDAVSDEVLLGAFGELQAQLVTSLRQVDPAGLAELLAPVWDAIETALTDNAPQAVADGLASGYGALVSAFQAIDPAAVPEALRPLQQQAGVLIGALDPVVRVGALQAAFGPLAGQVDAARQAADLSALAPAVAPVAHRLSEVVPTFLEHDLTVEAIRAGMAELSPAALAARVNAPFDALYARVEALGPALQSEYEAFLDALGDKLMELSPFMIFDRFRAIYQAVVDQILVIDPRALADDLNNRVYTPLLSKFEALHPRHIREAIEASFGRVVGKVEALDLAGVAAAIDATLATLLSTLDELRTLVNVEELRAIFQTISGLLRDLPILEVFQALVDAFARLRDELERTLTVAGTAFDDMIAALPG